MTTPTYSDRERQARALLHEEANRILMAHPQLISAEVELRNADGLLSASVWIRDGNGSRFCGMGATIEEATQSALAQIKSAHDLAAEKRARAAELLAEAARLEQTAAA